MNLVLKSGKHNMNEVLKSRKDIYSQISAMLSLVLDNDTSGFFTYLNRSKKKTLFNYTKKTRELHY